MEIPAAAGRLREKIKGNTMEIKLKYPPRPTYRRQAG
jgi:hypothetical protein